MTREEDNRKMIEATTMKNMKVDYQQGMIYMMGTVTTILFDISKSLAIIADALRPERDLREFLEDNDGEPKPPEDRNE